MTDDALKPRIRRAPLGSGGAAWRLFVPGYLEYYKSFEDAVSGLLEWWRRGNWASFIRRPGAGPDGRREAWERIMRAKFDGALLRSNDPEPPVGSRVLDGCAEYWTRGFRGEACGWTMDRFDGLGDRESWTKVAGNYGPVGVVEWGERDD